MADPASSRSFRRFLWFPAGVLLLLAVGWPLVWWGGARFAEQRIDDWLAREAQAGRTVRCAARETSGFPFRFQMRCVDPVLEWSETGRDIVIRAKALRVVAMVYDPSHVIAEADGPAIVSEEGVAHQLVASWETARASFIGTPERPERVSLELVAPQAERVEGDVRQMLFRSSAYQLHLRRAQGAGSDADIEISSQIAKGEVAAPHPFGQPFDSDLLVTLVDFGEISPQPLPQRLDQWKVMGAKAHVQTAKLTSPRVALSASGDVALPQGKPTGVLQTQVVGLEELVGSLVEEGVLPKEASQYAPMVGMLGKPVTVDGRKGFTLPLRMDNGVMFLGPLPVAGVPALF